MSDEAAVVRFAEEVAKLAGGLVDVLVNNAATFVFESAEEVTEAGKLRNLQSSPKIQASPLTSVIHSVGILS